MALDAQSALTLAKLVAALYPMTRLLRHLHRPLLLVASLLHRPKPRRRPFLLFASLARQLLLNLRLIFRALRTLRYFALRPLFPCRLLRFLSSFLALFRLAPSFLRLTRP